jgi:hypothetical protein
MGSCFPTLDLIDRAQNNRARSLRQATNADLPECRARELAPALGGEFAWLTGVVGELAFRWVIAESGP